MSRVVKTVVSFSLCLAAIAGDWWICWNANRKYDLMWDNAVDQQIAGTAFMFLSVHFIGGMCVAALVGLCCWLWEYFKSEDAEK